MLNPNRHFKSWSLCSSHLKEKKEEEEVNEKSLEKQYKQI